MGITREEWGELDGQPVHRFTVSNKVGTSFRVTNYGATATELHVPDGRGETADVILGHDTLAEYLVSPTYFGATVGRYGNRIRRGKFTLDGVAYSLACNEGSNHLHGGDKGFDKRVWQAVPDDDGQGIRFFLFSPHLEEGFPGALMVTSSYRLNDDNVLDLEMTATTDRPTILNIVHHSYFNLAGQGRGDVLGHELQIHSDFYSPCDDELMVTGEMLAVEGTAFDFRQPTQIGKNIGKVENAGAGRLSGESGGYDHNFALRGQLGTLRPVLKVKDLDSGRGFELSSTEPGVHFYTGGYLDETIIGKGGLPYEKFAGFTIETQKFPDGPNLSHFPSTRLEPGELYCHKMSLKLFAD